MASHPKILTCEPFPSFSSAPAHLSSGKWGSIAIKPVEDFTSLRLNQWSSFPKYNIYITVLLFCSQIVVRPLYRTEVSITYIIYILHAICIISPKKLAIREEKNDTLFLYSARLLTKKNSIVLAITSPIANQCTSKCTCTQTCD